MRTIRLCSGAGKEGESHCVMSATSIVAGEEFSDEPSCVCPTIRRALIRVNDSCPTNEIRERLLSHLPWLIIGTNSGDIKVLRKRAELFAEFAKKQAASAYASAAASAAAYAAAYADAYASAAAAAYASAAAYAYVAYAYAYAYAWERRMKEFIDFIEAEIIPVYTTMPIEPGYRIDELVTVDEE